MQRRRGLTRGEEKQIKQIQIEELKARIGYEKSGIDERIAANQSGYDAAEKQIADYYAFEENKLFEMKDVRDSEIDYMKKDYDYKQGLIVTYSDTLTTEYGKMYNEVNDLYGLLTAVTPEESQALFDAFGTDIPSYFNTSTLAAQDFYNMMVKVGKFTGINAPESTWVAPKAPVPINTMNYIISIEPSGLPAPPVRYTSSSGRYLNENQGKFKLGERVGWQRGSYYIPETKPYMLHKGETVSPAGRNVSNNENIKIDPITINMNIYDMTDINGLTQKIETALQAGLLSITKKKKLHSALTTGDYVLTDTDIKTAYR